MKILLTNHHLREYTGTEVSTFVLAKYLKKYGNSVTVYSRFTLPNFLEQFKELDIRVINSLETINNESFDIAHIQHNICAYEVRYFFPQLPMIMWSHGVIPFLEFPPFMNLNITKFLATNQNVFNHTSEEGIQQEKIEIFRNLIDPDSFYEAGPIHRIPKNALIISNKITPEKEQLLKNVLNKLNIRCEFIGKRFKIVPNSELNKYINKSDIVFSVGLGAIEAMFCGRIPIIYDYNNAPYDDGIVTNKNFEHLMECNFSGRATKQIFNEKTLAEEIKKYNQKEGQLLKEKAIKYYDANSQVKKIIGIYKDVLHMKEPPKLKRDEQKGLTHIVNIINMTRFYSVDTLIKMTDNENTSTQLAYYKLKKDVEKFTSSRTYKAWRGFHKLKRFFFASK